jgi:hypothetical protein
VIDFIDLVGLFPGVFLGDNEYYRTWLFLSIVVQKNEEIGD